MFFVERGSRICSPDFTASCRSHWASTTWVTLFLKQANGFKYMSCQHANLIQTLSSDTASLFHMSSFVVGRHTIKMSTRPTCWWWSRESILVLELVLEAPGKPIAPEKWEQLNLYFILYNQNLPLECLVLPLESPHFQFLCPLQKLLQLDPQVPLCPGECRCWPHFTHFICICSCRPSLSKSIDIPTHHTL